MLCCILFYGRQKFFPNSFLFDVLPISPEIEMEEDWGCSDLSDYDWISIEDPNQGYFKVDFTAPTTPSIPEVETYASNESSMSGYYKLAKVVLPCLLYTSPSPRDGLLSRMPSSA